MPEVLGSPLTDSIGFSPAPKRGWENIFHSHWSKKKEDNCGYYWYYYFMCIDCYSYILLFSLSYLILCVYNNKSGVFRHMIFLTAN